MAILASLHWLPESFKIKVLVIACKAQKAPCLAPRFISDLHHNPTFLI